MVAYRITGTFYPGVPWEDFSSPTGPYVTMVVAGEPDSIEIPNGKTFVVVGPGDDNWYDVTVTELTEETAKAVLAEIIKVTPEEISIEQQGVCNSI